jgi:putative transposase
VVQVGAERALAGGDPLGRQAGGDPVQQPGAPGGQLGEPGVGVGLDPLRSRQRAQALGQAASGGIWRICAVIDYATKYCVAATVTPTSRGQDALGCLRRAVVEAERVLDLDDLRADRGVMDVVDADDYVIGEAPAPIAVVTDNGPCFRGVTFADAFAGDDPLFRHVRTRVRSPQTNGVVERFFGTLKYEHLYRATIGDGNALAVEVNLFRHTYNTLRPHQALDERTPRAAYLTVEHCG